MEHSTLELVALARQGNDEAIAELYSLSKDAVYKGVRIFIRDEDTALDVMQDAYITAFKRLDQLKNPEKFTSWVKKIGVNTARNYLKQRRDIPLSQLVNEDGDEMEFEDTELSHLPEAAMDRKVTAQLVDRILGALSDAQREVIVLHYYQGMSEQEIAEAQGCSVNTVKSRMLYAKKKIERAVLALEKEEGVKLYSMAPLPFLLWLLRMAKKQGIPVETVSGASAAGAAAAIGNAAGAASGTTAAGGTAVGGTAAGNAAAVGSTAVHTVGKTVAAKIVAGALAVTIAGGAAAVHDLNAGNTAKEAEAAHAAYVELLDSYQEVLQSGPDGYSRAFHDFWHELVDEIYHKYIDANQPIPNPLYLEYNGGSTFDNGLPVPSTQYTPFLDKKWDVIEALGDEEITDFQFCFAFQDIDRDGIEELFMTEFHNGEQFSPTRIYSYRNGSLSYGTVKIQQKGEKCILTLHPYHIMYSTYTYGELFSIQMNTGTAFSGRNAEKKVTYYNPDLDWQVLFKK